MRNIRFTGFVALLSVVGAAAYAAGKAGENAGILVISDITVHDEETYQRYRDQVKPIIERQGGRYLVRAGAKFVSDDPSTALLSTSGGWNPDRMIVLHFQSLDDLERVFGSDEYAQIVDLRTSSSTSKTVVVQALE